MFHATAQRARREGRGGEGSHGGSETRRFCNWFLGEREMGFRGEQGSRGATELRGQVRSQMEFGNEGNEGREHRFLRCFARPGNK